MLLKVSSSYLVSPNIYDDRLLGLVSHISMSLIVVETDLLQVDIIKLPASSCWNNLHQACG